MEENPEGLHLRYIVQKADGTVDPKAVYFVLRLDNHGDDPNHINACRRALRLYCCEISTTLPKLANDLTALLEKLETSS